MAAAPALLARQDLQVRDMAPTVSRVYPGIDGKLVYVPDDQGNIIHDASHAGYGGGGVAIPTVPIKETIWPVAGDNTANIQGAITKVAALPLDRNGFRGTVLLRAGYYRMATPVTITPADRPARRRMGDTGPPRRQRHGPAGRRAGRGPRGTATVPAARPVCRRRPWWRAWAYAAGRAAGRAAAVAASAAAPPRLIRIAGAAGAGPRDETKQTMLDGVRPRRRTQLQGDVARGFSPANRDRSSHRQPGVDSMRSA